MLFKDIIGHEAVKDRLRQTVAEDRISHALLFAGGEGTGALPLAMAYAQYVHCRNRTPQDACGECPECYRMQRMEHPDFHFVFPVNTSSEAVATGRSDDKPRSDQFLHLWRQIIPETGGYFTEAQWYERLGIENKQGLINKNEANELLRKMALKSFEGGYKTVVIWLPERLHDSAANTLLKLIEEPPAGTLFLFVSERPDQIIATIRSRTQLISLAALDDSQIAEKLQADYGLDPDRAGEISRLAQGNWIAARGTARPADQTSVAGELDDYFIRLMRLCYQQKYLELFSWAEEIAGLGREKQKQFCSASLNVLRECYLTGAGMEPISYTPSGRISFCRNFAPYVNHLTVENYIREYELLLSQLRQNGNPKILFTHFAMSLCKIVAKARTFLKQDA